MSSSSHFRLPRFSPQSNFFPARREHKGVLSCPEGLTDSKSTTFAILVLTPGGMWAEASSNWNAQTRLYYVHREEYRADRLDREGRQRSRAERPPLAREERVRAILSQRARTKYTDRDKDYSLRDSEIHTLSEVGKFRVAAAKDLAELAYNGDRARWRTMSKAWRVRVS